MTVCKFDIMEVLDRANAAVSNEFEKYCHSNGMIPKEVSISAKAKGVPKYLVCQLFNDLPSGASPCGDGTGGETKKETQTMKKKPTAKKSTAAKVAAKPTKKPATVKKPAKVAAKPAPAKKSAKVAAKPAPAKKSAKK